MRARTDLVVGTNFVFVLVIGFDIGVVVIGVGDGSRGDSDPSAAEDVTAFDIVAGDGRTSCVGWSLPSDLHTKQEIR